MLDGTKEGTVRHGSPEKIRWHDLVEQFGLTTERMDYYQDRNQVRFLDTPPQTEAIHGYLRRKVLLIGFHIAWRWTWRISTTHTYPIAQSRTSQPEPKPFQFLGVRSRPGQFDLWGTFPSLPFPSLPSFVSLSLKNSTNQPTNTILPGPSDRSSHGRQDLRTTHPN